MSPFHPLSPGLWLMQRLRLRGKLLVLAAASALPLLIVWVFEGQPSLRAGALVATLLGLGLLAYLMLSFYASFMSDFRQVLGAMEKTALGNLRSAMQVRGRDELADLARLLDRTIGNLSAMVAEVRSNSALVAHAGKSLAVGNRDLADRTEQQAANLEQTAASVHELSGTVQQNARTAGESDQRPRRCAMWRSRARSPWVGRSSRSKASRRAPSR
jgi:methyl-accepting chemotaxis protein